MQPKIKRNQLIAYLLIFVAAPTLTFLLGLWLDRRLGFPVFPAFPLNLFLGSLIMIIGSNLGVKSTRQLYEAGRGLPWGEADHAVETSRLVNSGIYAYSRNPMVLGYSMLPVGMGLMFQSIGMTISLSPIVLLINYLIVKTREEPRLIKRFGVEYIRYRDETPFLFPNWLRLLENYIMPYIRAHFNQLSYVFLAEVSLFVTCFVVFQDLPSFDLPIPPYIPEILFVCICLLGIVAGVAPRLCSVTSRNEKHEEGSIGHHPDCEFFLGHTVSIAGRRYCAGCSGLIIGAVISLIGSVSRFYPFDLFVGFWFGVLLVSIGLFQHFIDLGSGWVHFWLNIGLVLGDWLMFMAIRALNLSPLVSIYFLGVTIWWIYARIRTSQWIHVDICNRCVMSCKHYF